MRFVPVLVALAALLAIPGALAMDQVTFQAPDLNAHVHGTTTTFDSSQYVSSGPGVATHVETKDVGVNEKGGRCALNPNDKRLDIGRVEKVCDPGSVSTTKASTDVVQATVDIRLPSAATPVPPPSPPARATAAVVQVVQSSPRFMVAAAAAGVSLLALAGIWRVLKLTGLAALLPLYSHLSDDEILEDPNRAGIYRLIQEEPGISTKDIADRLGLAWGTVTHHLGKLEKRRFVVSKKYGKYRRYFANGEGGSDKKDALAVLRVDRTGDVAALIRSHPGMTQKAVSEALGVSSSTILWHVKRLEEVQLVTKVREGKLVRYYPGEGLQAFDIIPAAPVANAA